MTIEYAYEPESMMDTWRDEARDWATGSHDFELPDIDPDPCDEVAVVDYDLSDFAPAHIPADVVPAGYFPQRAHWYVNANWMSWADIYNNPPF